MDKALDFRVKLDLKQAHRKINNKLSFKEVLRAYSKAPNAFRGPRKHLCLDDNHLRSKE